jgi:hypothetical protein
MTDLQEMAFRLRRDAGRRSRSLEGAERRLEGWKLVLSVARHDNATALTRAAESMRATFGDAFVDGHPLFQKLDGVSESLDKWHLMASWVRSRPPSTAMRALLAEILPLLGIPENSRDGKDHETVAYPTGEHFPACTHWMWGENTAQATSTPET